MGYPTMPGGITRKKRDIIVKNKIIASRIRIITDKRKKLIHEKANNTIYGDGDIFDLKFKFNNKNNIILSITNTHSIKDSSFEISLDSKFEIDFKDITDFILKKRGE